MFTKHIWFFVLSRSCWAGLVEQTVGNVEWDLVQKCGRASSGWVGQGHGGGGRSRGRGMVSHGRLGWTSRWGTLLQKSGMIGGSVCRSFVFLRKINLKTWSRMFWMGWACYKEAGQKGFVLVQAWDDQALPNLFFLLWSLSWWPHGHFLAWAPSSPGVQLHHGHAALVPGLRGNTLWNSQRCLITYLLLQVCLLLQNH